MDSLSWGISQFVIQTVLHSVVIVIVVEAMIGFWHVQKPSLQIKFRFLALLPVIYLPFYFLLDSSRAGAHFYEQVALIDFNQWLRLRLVGNVTAWHLLIIMLALTTFFFLLREAIPCVRYFLRSHSSLPAIEPGQFPKLDQVLARLTEKNHFRVPKILLSAEAVPMVYNLVQKALFLSADTINMLDAEELEAVIAHELAHLDGQDYRIAQISLLLRFLMFYNPVALFIFRRIVSDRERDCDDMAVQVTGKRLALASGLLRIFRQTAVPAKPHTSRSRFMPRLSTLGSQFSWNLIKERVERLIHPEKTSDLPYANLRVLLTAALLLIMLFFVV